MDRMDGKLIDGREIRGIVATFYQVSKVEYIFF